MEGISLEELFPTDGVVPEERQIGRQGAIQRLTGRLIGGRNTLLLEPRRVGKTSVALAALKHCRSDHNAITLQVDLVDGARTPKQITTSLMKQASDQDVGKATAKLKRRNRLRSGKSLLDQPGVEAASQLLELDDAEEIATTVAAVLGGEDDADLGRLLLALDADAHVSDRQVVVLVDEVQALSTWGEEGEAVQRQLASALRRSDTRTTFVFAGSKRHAVEELFAEGKPLHYAGLDFDLDTIAPEEWHAGLRARFEEAGYSIKNELLDHMIAASGGHPLRTMQICAHAYEWAQNSEGSEVSGAAVLRGIASAREHPSWKEADQ